VTSSRRPLTSPSRSRCTVKSYPIGVFPTQCSALERKARRPKCERLVVPTVKVLICGRWRSAASLVTANVVKVELALRAHAVARREVNVVMPAPVPDDRRPLNLASRYIVVNVTLPATGQPKSISGVGKVLKSYT